MLEVTSAMICCAEDVGELERQSVLRYKQMINLNRD